MMNHIVVELALTGLIQFSLYELFHVINLVQTLLEFSLVVWVIAEDGRVLLNYLLFILIHFIVESLKLRQPYLIKLIILLLHSWLEILVVFINIILLAVNHLAVSFRAVLVMIVNLVLELNFIVLNSLD
jgi:hypothetical protein